MPRTGLDFARRNHYNPITERVRAGILRGGGRLEPEAKRTLSYRTLTVWLWPLFRPYRGHFAGAFLLLVVSAGLLVVGPLLVKRAIDDNIAQSDIPGLKVTVLLFVLVQVAYLITLYVMRNWLEWAGQQVMADLRRKIFAHLISLPLEFHDRTTPGQLLSRLESDTQALRMLFTTTVVMLLGDFLMMLGMAGVMVWYSPQLTLITGSVLPLMILVTVLFQKQFRHRFVEVRRQNSQISSQLAELIQAVPLLQAYARHRWATTRLMEITRQKYDTQAIAEWYVIVWFNLIFVIETLALCLILGVGGAWALSGMVTIGLLAMFMGYVRRFFDPLHRLAEQLAMIQKAFASAERVLKLLEEPNTVPDPVEPMPFTELKGEICFEHVWFRYGEGGEWVLKDVSFTLPVGESWALVGPTGSGKTTIVSLLLRFYDPQEGRILVDGVDLKELSLPAFRQRLGMVLQDLYLFPGNLRENLTMGRDVSEEMLKQSGEITLADRFIRHLPQGDQTDLAERGSNLSVGQRQLLSFTRALAGDPDLLILDEATSAVDPATEHVLSTATRRVLKGRTALIIAHRLSTIRHCHRILVLRQGEIIEQGSHAELLATDGLYRTLHNLQFSEADLTPNHEGTPR